MNGWCWCFASRYRGWAACVARRDDSVLQYLVSHVEHCHHGQPVLNGTLSWSLLFVIGVAQFVGDLLQRLNGWSCDLELTAGIALQPGRVVYSVAVGCTAFAVMCRLMIELIELLCISFVLSSAVCWMNLLGIAICLNLHTSWHALISSQCTCDGC